MGIKRTLRHLILAALLSGVGFSLPLQAQQTVPELFESLQNATPEEANRLDKQINAAWSRSGSASMDLLLRRGRAALEDRNFDVAVEHFTALTDHAPDFAEGWHGLALAYFEQDLFGPTLDALGHVLALEPDHYPAMYGLGVMFRAFEDFARADAAFRKVLDLHPHHEEAKQALESLKQIGIGRTL